jgi:hypothetical protein
VKYCIQGLGEAEYTICGVRIPKKRYNEAELKKGKRNIVTVSGEKYADVCRTAEFRRLLETGKVSVSVDKTHEPEFSQVVRENKKKQFILGIENEPEKKRKRKSEEKE